MEDTRAKIQAALELLAGLEDIKRLPMHVGLPQLNDWLSDSLPEVKNLLADANQEMEPDFPDQQSGLNYEYRLEIEGRMPA